ncbi:MAG: ABC transporter ATP-binding protein [bacterium]|nr:ABC transporter ATP-binding protein [bacterium]
MSVVLQLWNITKSFGKTFAVKDVTIQVHEGTICGLIGADGAGKSTLLRIACGLIPPDTGSVQILNEELSKNLKRARQVIGYMPQRFSLYQDLSVEENIRFFAKLFRVHKKEREQLERKLYHFSKLEPFKHRRAGDLSGGMKQKLALSCTLMNDPKLLLLDEPTYGVDPISRQELWEILLELKRKGAAILVSTAYMDEAEKCDWIYGMHQGKMVLNGTKEKIVSQFQQKIFQVEDPTQQFSSLFELKKKLSGFFEIKQIFQFGNSLHIMLSNSLSENIIHFFHQNNLTYKEINIGISDAFFLQTKKQEIE